MEPRVTARRLDEARRSRIPIPPFGEGLTAEDGYAVQQELVKLLPADGDRVVGHRVGLTSKPMRRLVGMDSPDHGRAGVDGVPVGRRVPLSRYIPQGRCGAAFVLGGPLRGPGVGLLDAARAVAGVAAAVAFVDSRIEDWRIGLAGTLGEVGAGLEPGHLVMTGALHAAVPMAAGDVFRAEFDVLGAVTVRVVA